jgi:methyl-accepting chemotaxis protein
MKKPKILLTLIIGIIIGIMASIGVYFLTEGDVAWQEYIEVKVIPNVVLALSTISALCVAVMPLLTKIKLTLTSFDKATQDVNGTAQSGKNATKTVLECKDEIKQLMAEIKETKDEMKQMAVPIQQGIDHLEKITRIGFCNTSELVKNGYAREIAKVGHENENTEI